VTSEIGGQGTVGVAFETTVGTFVAPTKWIPIRSESLQLVEDKIYRMNIRQMIEYHVEKRAGVTIAAIPVEKQLGVELTWSPSVEHRLYLRNCNPGISETQQVHGWL